ANAAGKRLHQHLARLGRRFGHLVGDEIAVAENGCAHGDVLQSVLFAGMQAGERPARKQSYRLWSSNFAAAAAARSRRRSARLFPATMTRIGSARKSVTLFAPISA